MAAESYTLSKDMPLSVIDCSFTGNYGFSVQFAFFYDKRQNAAVLERALREVLEPFVPVRSALIFDEYRVWLNPLSAAAVEFSEVERSGLTPSTDSMPNRLAHLDLPLTYGPKDAVARFCLNQYDDGAVLMANISHTVADGFSYFYFMSSWGRQARGKAYAAPCHDRSLLIPDTGDLRPSPAEVEEKTGLCFAESRKFAAVADIEWDEAFFDEPEFFRQNGLDLREFAGNTLLTAYLWKLFSAKWYRDVPDSRKLFLSCAVDLRTILRKTVPQTYFGNAIQCVFIPATVAEVRDLPLRALCEKIRKGIFGLTASCAMESLKYLTAYQKIAGLAGLQGIHIAHSDGGMLVTNLSRLPIHELDFGLGAPIGALPIASSSRIAVVLPGGKQLRVIVSG